MTKSNQPGNHGATRRVVVQSSYDLAANFEFESATATADATSAIEDDEEGFQAQHGGALDQETGIQSSQDKPDSHISKRDKEKRSRRRARKRRLEAEAKRLGGRPVKEVARKRHAAWLRMHKSP